MNKHNSSSKLITHELSSFISNCKYEDLPEKVKEQARLCILDTLGVIIKGHSTQPVYLVTKYIKSQGGTPCSTVFTKGFKTTSFNATYANGASAHSIELDDGHVAAHNHPGAVVIPAAFSVGEREGVSGKDFLTSVVLGYDINIRLGKTIHGSTGGALYRRWFHPSAVTGSFASAATSSKLLKLDTEKTKHSFGIAGLGPASTMGTFHRGGFSKHSFCGWSSAVGVLAADLAVRGYTGDDTIFESDKGFCQAISDDYKLEYLYENLGIEWNILDIYRKRHAMCSDGHPILDGALQFLKEGLKAEYIKQIRIHTYNFVYNMPTDLNIKSAQQARLNMPYTLATVIIRGKPISPENFSPEALVDRKVLELASKVKIFLDSEANQYQIEHNEGLSKIEIELNDGKILKKTVTVAKGWPNNPLSKDEIYDKFKVLTNHFLDSSKINEVINLIMKIEEMENIKYLFNFLY